MQSEEGRFEKAVYVRFEKAVLGRSFAITCARLFRGSDVKRRRENVASVGLCSFFTLNVSSPRPSVGAAYSKEQPATMQCIINTREKEFHRTRRNPSVDSDVKRLFGTNVFLTVGEIVPSLFELG